MNVKIFREIIEERKYIEQVSFGEWTEGLEECWRKEISTLTEDIPASIVFLENECTADEFSWISEVIDDIAIQTGSKEFINSYKKLMLKYPEECEKFNIRGSIMLAEEALKGHTADE